MSVNAFRRYLIGTLGGNVQAAGAVCRAAGVAPDVADRCRNVSKEEFEKILGEALRDVPLEVFDESVRVNSPLKFESRLRFDLPADAIADLAEEVIQRSKQIEDGVAKAQSPLTFENTVKPLADQERILSPLMTNCDFLQHVSADKEIRDACVEADKLVNSYFVESAMRQDVFDTLVRYAAKKEPLKGEKQRLLDRLLRDFRRNGLELDLKTRSRVQEIQKEMSELKIVFQKNLGEENTKLEFTAEHLDGMGDDYLSKLDKSNSGLYLVSLKYPEALPLMKLCKVEASRKRMEYAFNRRCIEENTPILEKLVRLRHEQANLLGFSSHSKYILDIRMAKSPQVVLDFLNSLNSKLTPLANIEMSELLELKKEEIGEKSFDGRINMWDFQYFLNLRQKLKYEVDHEELKAYFPINVVTKGLLGIYQQLLSLRFTKLDKPHVWHPDVQMYSVHDGQQLVGYFYLDLHPREGKYGHAACFGLQAQCDGQFPVAACVANFSKPSATSPSLLRHQEVVTFYHEFGHVMHQLCSKVQFARFSGTRVERDFVECPSQMLENWCWEEKTLSMMCGHYQDQSKKIPDHLLQKLVGSKNANAGLTEKRQLLFGLFDQTIHSQSSADTAEILSKLQLQVLGIPMTPGTNFASSFGHLAGGYDAQYYGYMWSQVYSMDMFATRFKNGGLLNPSVGADYRNMILAKGGSRDAMESLREFLGREPNQKAFLEEKGLSV